MKKLLFYYIVLCLFFPVFACAKTEEKTLDIFNRNDYFLTPPEKISAGTVSVAYLLSEFENKNVVSVPTSKRPLPIMYSELEKTGHPENPNIEKLQSLNPDIYISISALKSHTAEAIENRGIRTIYLNLYTYENCLNSILELGKILNEEEKASDIVTNIKNEAEKFISEISKSKSPKVLLLTGMPPRMQTACKNSYAGSLLEALQIKNIADEIYKTEKPYTPFNIEEIVKKQPDIILVLSHKNIDPFKAAVKDFFKNDDIWKNIEAVKKGRVYVLDPFIFTVNKGSGIVQAFKVLKEIVYGKNLNGEV